MEVHVLILLTYVGVVCVSGQFFLEYTPENIPFHRRRLTSATYEIQPSLPYEPQDTVTRSSGPGRRHIESRQKENIEYEQNNRNVKKTKIQPDENIYDKDNKNYETSPASRTTKNNIEHQINYDNQHSARLQQQTENSNNNIRENNIQHVKETTGNQNVRNNGNVNSNVYDSNLKTNADNTNLYQNAPIPNQESFNQLQTNANARTNANSGKQRKVSETTGRNEPYVRTNANNRNIVKTETPELNSTQLYLSDDNVRTNNNPVNRQDDTRPDGAKSRPTEATRRSIDSYSPGNRQNIASLHNSKPNKQSTDYTPQHDNRNYEINKQGVDPSDSIVVEQGSEIDRTKATQDNELASKTHLEGRSETKEGDKWIWSGSEKPTTLLPAVDDRAAFSGGKCPTGQVRFNDICVDKD